MELSGTLQKLQNEVNCMNDSKDFRDAESICNGNSSGNVFAHPQTSSSTSYPQELNFTWRKTIEEPFTCPQRRTAEDQKTQI